MTSTDNAGSRTNTIENAIFVISKPGVLFSIFLISIIMFYCALPAGLAIFFDHNQSYTQLALLAGLSALGLAVGYRLPWLDRQITAGPKLKINSSAFHWIVWGSFALYVLAVMATAPSIPLVSAILGADTRQISMERGNFLKLREGLESSFQYFSTFYTGFLLPYSLALMVLERRRAWPFALIFSVIYNISFMQKALFLRSFAPVAFLAAQRKMSRPLAVLAVIAVATVGLLYLNVVLERDEVVAQPAPIASTAPAPTSQTVAAPPEIVAPPAEIRHYFSAKYVPSSAIDHIVWRTFAVPVFTAADAVLVFDKQFHWQPLWGATSTPIAALTGQERVNYDSLVFAEQWGESLIGRANSVYFTELLINFNWGGVFLISILIGMTFRWFSISHDYAFKSMIMIYMLQLFSAGLIGILLSNGFILLFFVCLFVNISRERSGSRDMPSESLTLEKAS